MNDKRQTAGIRTQYPQSKNREHSVPLYLTSSFTFNSAEQGQALFSEQEQGNIYSRFSNPNTSEFINKMCLFEQMEDGFAFASGMAAIFAGFAALLKQGDHVLASRALFGSSFQILEKILPKWGIETTFFDCNKPQSWEALVKKNSRMIFVETPSNPGLDLVDLERVKELKEKYNLLLFVDNTFATPFGQLPVLFGADLIAHSATKYLDGQGRVLGGVVVGKEEIIKEIRFFARQTGPAMSPFNAWMLSKSMETLQLRMEKHNENAQLLAEKLEQSPHLKNIRYPGLKSHPQHTLARAQMLHFGGIITFNVHGGAERAMRFMNKLKLISLTANLGDTRTICTHPASTTHSKLTVKEQEAVSITPGLIRISVGLENSADILEDITQALNSSEIK